MTHRGPSSFHFPRFFFQGSVALPVHRSSPFKFPGIRVQLLLLDNDANFRRALAISLRLDGIMAFEATDVPTAEALASARRFDAAVLHMTDLEACAGFVAYLHERNPDCRVVICSSHEEMLVAARANLPQPVLELLRPFSANRLLSCLGR